MPIELRSVEFDITVQDWQTQELVASHVLLVTNQAGRFNVPGILQANFEWRAVADEPAFEGTFELRLDSGAAQIVLE